MPSFRFRIPFFSHGSPSRLSSGTASPSPPVTPPPPPPPPPPSRPPFRPAGIAQPSRSETSPETKSKVPPSLSRFKSNVATSSSASQSPSRSAAKPIRRVKQTNQFGSPLKKLESLRTEEQKVTMKEMSGETVGENINAVIKKPLIARSGEHLERREVEEKRKKTEIEKLAVQERNKVHEGNGEKSESDQGQQQKRKEKDKLALQETKRALQAVGREDATRNKTTRQISADLPERKTKTQNRTDNQTDDNHQKTKGVSTSNHGNQRVQNGDGSSSMSRRIKEDIRDGISKLANGDEKSVSVITLTGENRGATMAIGSEKDKKDGEVHIHRGYRSNPDESPNTTATETEGGRRPFSKGENLKEEEETTVRAYVNGNTQGINNSIVLESSVSENDPGVHMSLKIEESKKEIISPQENAAEKKSETVTRKEPRVRRRCLRGLLAESSESEPENPLKPRRHGCRFTCKDKDIENI